MEMESLKDVMMQVAAGETLQSFDTFHQMQEVLVFSTSQKDYAVYETLSSMSYVCQ